MKKNYIAPSMEIAEIELQQMVAASGFTTNQEGLGGLGGTDTDGSMTPSSRRRGGSVWDDDEDDWD